MSLLIRESLLSHFDVYFDNFVRCFLVDLVLVLREQSSCAVVPLDGPVGPFEELSDCARSHLSLLISDVGLLRLELVYTHCVEPIRIVLANLRSLNDWLPPLVPRYDHVSLWQLLWRERVSFDYRLSVFFDLLDATIPLLVVHDDLLHATGCVTVHQHAFSWLTHLNHLVLVHGSQD